MAALKIFGTLALATLALGQSQQQQQPRQQMVQAPFNATAFSQLMDCVRNASSRYEFAVERESGTLLIIPEQGGTIDLDSPADEALGDCLDKFSPYLSLAVDDTRTNAEGTGSPTATQDIISALWAESNGAMGMTSQNSTRLDATSLGLAPGSPALLPRQVTKSYFFSLGDDEGADCRDHDQQNNVLNECISFGSPYRSIIFSNPNEYNSIRVKRWPHHKCNVDRGSVDGRTVTVPARSDSTCYNYPKQTFSFRGKLVPKSCFGTCQ